MAKKSAARSLISIFFLTLTTIVFLFPVFIMVTRACMTGADATNIPALLVPSVFSWEGFARAFQSDIDLLLGLRNTMILVVSNCILIPLSSSLCAFGFAKLKFKGKEFWFFVALCTTMIPTIVTQIPLYRLFTRTFGWKDSLLPLIVPSIFGGGALNIFLIRQYMRGIPNSIMEAAKIDGANWFSFFVQFAMPMSKPVVVLVMVQTFMAVWNDFMGPLVYLRRAPEMKTLGVEIYTKFLSDRGGKYPPHVRMAIGVMLTVPPAIMFLCFQKELVDGVAMSGMKL